MQVRKYFRGKRGGAWDSLIGPGVTPDERENRSGTLTPLAVLTAGEARLRKTLATRFSIQLDLISLEWVGERSTHRPPHSAGPLRRQPTLDGVTVPRHPQYNTAVMRRTRGGIDRGCILGSKLAHAQGGMYARSA